MKWIDIPPVWLLVALVATYWIGQAGPFGFSFDHPILQAVSVVLIGVGLLLMLLAVLEMRRHRTTVIPHLEADHLVQTGIFKQSRNPIYLGDVLVLAGLILRWDALLAVPLIGALIWVLQRRFIVPEEDRLRRKFPQNFDSYTMNTRRWL